MLILYKASTLNPITMDMQSSTAVMPKMDPDKRLGFLDLPPEIRNMIYKLLLPRYGVKLMYGNYHHEGDASWSPRTSPYARLLRLLRTCHQIREEAAHVAYGSVTFYFEPERYTLAWLERRGSMVRYIRKVYIWGHMILGSFSKILHLLKQAEDFRRLMIDSHFCKRPFQSGSAVERFAELLGPLAKAVHKKRQHGNQTQNTAHIFCARKYDPDMVFPADLDSWDRWCAQEAAYETQGVDQWEEELRGMLINILPQPRVTRKRVK